MSGDYAENQDEECIYNMFADLKTYNEIVPQHSHRHLYRSRYTAGIIANRNKNKVPHRTMGTPDTYLDERSAFLKRGGGHQKPRPNVKRRIYPSRVRTDTNIQNSLKRPIDRKGFSYHNITKVLSNTDERMFDEKDVPAAKINKLRKTCSVHEAYVDPCSLGDPNVETPKKEDGQIVNTKILVDQSRKLTPKIVKFDKKIKDSHEDTLRVNISCQTEEEKANKIMDMDADHVYLTDPCKAAVMRINIENASPEVVEDVAEEQENDQIEYTDKRSPKNWIKRNIENASKGRSMVHPPRYVETRYGQTQILENTGLISKYVYKANYGQLPSYIEKKNRAIVQAIVEQRNGQLLEQSQNKCKYVTQMERAEILQGLKQNWEKLINRYQKLPLVTDSMGKIATKNVMEAQLKDLENTIILIERNPYMYVYDDDDEEDEEKQNEEMANDINRMLRGNKISA